MDEILPGQVKKVLAISGFFAQVNIPALRGTSWLLRASTFHGPHQYMYHGELWFMDGVRFQGYLTDEFGSSFVDDGVLAGDKLSFVKKYNREDSFPIQYEFRKQPSGIWEGQYVSPETEACLTRCVITEFPSGFFDFDPSSSN